MHAADAIVKILESHGVQYVFGVPGEETLALLDSLRRSHIKFVLTRHEATAGFMAATIGRLTGIPGVALATLGPGATNLVTSIAYAQLGGMPTLFLTGQKPIKHSKQGSFQIIDAVSMVKPLTKFSRQIVSADLAPTTVAQAIKLSIDERPGAVHLELPEDIAFDQLSDSLPALPPTPRRPIAEAKAIQQAVTTLAQARHPLIIIGSGANRKRVSNMLTQLIDHTHLPFVSTQMGKGVVSEDRPEYLGTTALSNNDYIHQEIAKADCLLLVGHDTIEKPPYLLNSSHSPTLIHLNFFPASPDLVYTPDLEVVGDIANAIWQIQTQLSPSPHWDLSVFHSVTARCSQPLSQDSLSPFAIVQSVRAALAPTDIVALDNGMYKLWFARHYPCLAPNTLLLDNALATMGAGLGSAMAAKLLYPDRQVVCVVGDGGLLMSLGDLETAHRLNLDLTILLLRDNRYGMIDWKQRAAGLPTFGLEFGNPDFPQLASSFGLRAETVSSPSSLLPTLQSLLSQPGLKLLDIPIDYTDNQFLGVKS